MIGPSRLYGVLGDMVLDSERVTSRIVDARRSVQGWPDEAGGLRADELGFERRADFIAADVTEHLARAEHLIRSLTTELDAAWSATGRLYITENVNHS